MADTQILLQLTDIAKSYTAFQGAPETPVLRDVDLDVGAGETVAIVGPSGSGKTTLLNIIGTLDRPTSGRVLLNGRDLTALGDAELAAVRSREIGFIFQFHHLLPQCTVLENVLLPTLAGGPEKRSEPAHSRAHRLLHRVGLSERLTYRPGQLSGGERQRVAVVRALINEPRLLLADEPTGSLDRASADNLADLLVELNREEGVALIVITHALSLAERMERVYRIENGMLVPVTGHVAGGV
ncbi:MAG: ABC transporter ATP-binding protein [Chloroherpetonaceae bacterium]|nr:ABC transporter ATP-binding protein [Chthonomonadaceae bacterium]MDW8208490.1 ABC transporter ATP-binding protein [Chloroherpetonaceae bacterium]